MKTICFVCGSKGANSILYIRPRSKGAYFSFLENHDPPKGAKLPNCEGVVSACLVCYAFLNQQWDSFERTKTPLVKRLYWLKRVDNRSFTGAELNVQGEYVAQIMGVQYNCGISGNISPFDFGSHTGISCSIKDALPSPTNDSNLSPETDIPVERGGELNGVLDLSVSPKKPKVHSKKSQKSEEVSGTNGSKVLGSKALSTSGSKALSTNGQKAIGTSGSKTLSSDASSGPKNKNVSVVCYVCCKTCSASLARFVYAIRHSDDEPYFPFILGLAEPPGAMALTKNGVTQVCSECRKTLSRQWRIFESRKVPEMERIYKINDIPIRVEKTTEGDEDGGDRSVAAQSSGSACYLCGEITLLSSMFTLKTRKHELEEDVSRIVLPFIEKLKCPLGARPINSRGMVLVCGLCHNHILNQWKKFEENNLPVDRREYMLRPFLNASGSLMFSGDFEKTVPTESMVLEKKNLQRTPFLSDGKTLSKGGKESVEFSRETLHPFLLNRCPSDVRTKVTYSDAAFRVPYPSPLLLKTDCNKNMTARADCTTLADALACNGHVSSQELVQQRNDFGHTCCFLCGCKCKKLRINWKSAVSIYDRPLPDIARCSEDNKTCFVRPFFPFLSTVAPSAGAESISTDGRVDVCYICYQNLIGQWFAFEKSKDLEEQNRWLRKYCFRSYICTICRQSFDRLKMEIVTTQDSPVLGSIDDGLVSIEGNDSALVCLSCLEILRRGTEQNGKKCGKPGLKRRRTVDELTKVEPRDDEHQTKTSFNSSSLASAAAAAAKETDRQSLSSSSSTCSSSSSSAADKGIKTVPAEQTLSSVDSVAAAERETRGRRRRMEKGSEEPEDETPPPPPPSQHLFPRAASAAAAAAVGGESSSSYLEALKKLTMDSCSRAASTSCLPPTHDFSKPPEAGRSDSRKEVKSVLSAKETNLLEEPKTTTVNDDVVQRKFYHATEVIKKTDRRLQSNGQLLSTREEVVTKCRRSSSRANNATTKMEDGFSASTPTKTSPSRTGACPSSPLPLPAAAAASDAAGGRLGCNGFIPSTDRMLNSSLFHPSVLQAQQPHPSAPHPHPPPQLPFISPDALYLQQLISSTSVFGFPPLLPSSSSALRWDEYLAIQRLQQQQQMMSPSSPFLAPYSSLFPTSLIHPLLQPTSFSSPFLCASDRTSASTGLSSAFDLSSILRKRDAYKRLESMDAAGPSSDGEVEASGFWNGSTLMRNGCSGPEKEEEERNSGNDLFIGHGHSSANRKSVDLVTERQPQGGEKTSGAQRQKDSKPNFHRPFLENCSDDEEEEEEEELEVEQNDPNHPGKEEEPASCGETDSGTGKADKTRINSSRLLQTESYSDRMPVLSTGSDALTMASRGRLIAEFGQPKNGHLAAVAQPKVLDGLPVNGSLDAIRYSSSHLSKDELLSAALSLISLQSPRILSLVKRTVSQRDSLAALDNDSSDNDHQSMNNEDLSSEETNPCKRLRLDLNHVMTTTTSSKLTNNSNCTENKNDGRQTLPVDRLLSPLKPRDEEMMHHRPSSPSLVSDKDDNHQKAFRLPWPGIEAIIESYQLYCQDYASERQFLTDQGHQSTRSRRDLISSGETFSAKIVELSRMRQDLESERSQLQSSIDSLTCCLKRLR